MNLGEQLSTVRRVISRLLRQRRNRLAMDKRMAEVDLTLPDDDLRQLGPEGQRGGPQVLGCGLHSADL